MTELRVVLTGEAEADLLALERYIAERDGKQRANMILGRIYETIRTLAFMPGMGRPSPYLETGTRSFAVSPWSIFYVPLPELDGIRVVRVIDGRRDLDTLFGP